jgi:hypothetical protein
VEATGPRRTDRRTRTSSVPDRRAEQREIDDRFRRGLHFLGDWHTHPKNIPHPSGPDVASLNCKSAWGPGADRHYKILIYFVSEGSSFGADPQSIATMPSAWLRRNVFHPCEGGPLLRAIYLATLVWPISMPNFTSSPRILGAPHNGLAMLISRISRRISNGTVGRPQRTSRYPAPIRSETGTVPTDHGIRLHNRQRLDGIRLQTIPNKD